MSAGTNRQWLLAKRPEGLPEDPVGDHNFRWAESPLPVPSEGQVLVRNLWLSFDPTQLLAMSAYDEANTESPGIPIGGVMHGLAVAQVVESRLPGFRTGDLVHGFFGWEDYTVTDGRGFLEMAKVAPGIAPHLAAGTFGVTGMAAYFGVMEIGRPRPGETFVVSAAAGGVGSIASQIAKIQGARVIGIAGGREKCLWLVNELGLDGAIDHRSEDVGARLSALCPDGIDIYFDNSGGAVLDEALARLRPHGRVVLCGATAHYGRTAPSPGAVQLPGPRDGEWADGRAPGPRLRGALSRGGRGDVGVASNGPAPVQGRRGRRPRECSQVSRPTVRRGQRGEAVAEDRRSHALRDGPLTDSDLVPFPKSTVVRHTPDAISHRLDRSTASRPAAGCSPPEPPEGT